MTLADMHVKIDMETQCEALCICEYTQAQIGSKPLWLLLHWGENQNDLQTSEPGLLGISESSADAVLDMQTQSKAKLHLEHSELFLSLRLKTWIHYSFNLYWEFNLFCYQKNAKTKDGVNWKDLTDCCMKHLSLIALYRHASVVCLSRMVNLEHKCNHSSDSTVSNWCHLRATNCL